MSMGQYTNVSKEEFTKGSCLSLFNAFQLYEDALIMEFYGRMPRAYSLLKLSFEEVSKSLMLRDVAAYINSNEAFKNKALQMLEGLGDHNYKTKYCLEYLIALEERDSKNSTSPDLEKLRNLLSRIKELNFKKNTNFYTSLIEGQFVSPFQSMEQANFDMLNDITFRMFVRAKNLIFNQTDEYYSSIGLEPKRMEKLDPFYVSRKLNQMTGLAIHRMNELKAQYPHLNFDLK